MRRYRALALAAALAALAIPVTAGTPLPPLDLLGTVTASAHPASNALVIALNLEDFAASQTYTALDGSFSLTSLRAGIYKIIAVKQGFVPAIMTLVPTQRSHKISLKLETEKQAHGKSAGQAIWELRGSLPPDVLRELDQMLSPAETIVTYDIPRIRGEMMSMTGVTSRPADPAFAQTAVGVQGRIGDNWQVGIRGNIQRFDNPNDEVSFGTPIAESRNMSMELRSSPTDSYRVASTQSSWMYASNDRSEKQAGVTAHNFEWEHGAARVQVRYFEQENLFDSTATLGSNLIEIAGDMPVLQTRRNDIGVSLRVTQESAESAQNPMRVADIAANGRFEFVPSLMVHYGMASRLGVDGQEWAPSTGAQWKLTKSTSIIASAQVKVLDRDPSSMLAPSIVVWSEDTRVMPRYAYSFGFVSGKDEKNRLSAIVSTTATDAPLRVVFTDGYDQFWDGLSVDSGDVRRDVRVAYRREFGKTLALDIATTAGSATRRGDFTSTDGQKVYVTGDLQSTFRPTRTTLELSYRELQQPRDNTDYKSERVNVRIAQGLYLPVDVKLLLGLELARAANSPYLVETLAPEGTSKKYIGGLAFNF
ncbi:MAG TPA: carboxypeptidase-like regulatory domain-containing protein [Thermoanaerobaculia bacterium]|nr:carboxypeptidase-like regulatory domain-containing protein [Thermoanaerobaculia bacterium]